MKEGEATESFLGLSKEERGCQDEESYANCTTKHYTETLKKRCGCLPLSISINKGVFQKLSNSKSKNNFQDSICSKPAQIECIEKISYIDDSNCLRNNKMKTQKKQNKQFSNLILDPSALYIYV